MMFSLVASFVAADLSDTLGNTKDWFSEKFGDASDGVSGFSGSKWIVILVNAAVIGVIGYLILMLVASEILKDQGKIAIGAIAGLSLIISYQMYESDMSDFLWKIPQIKDFLHIRVLINLALVIAILYILYFWLLKSKEQQASKPFEFMIFAVIILIAINVIKPVPSYDDATYHYIWEWESIVPYRFMLLGDSGCTYYEFTEDTYFEKDGQWYKDAWWGGDEGWFGDDLITERDIKDDLNKSKIISSKKLEEITDPDDKKIYNVNKEKPEGTFALRQRLDRYCYTQKSVDEFIGYVRDPADSDEKKEYKPEAKDPSLEEIRSTGGFGLLRGLHLVMLIVGILVISWVMQVWGIIKEGSKLTYVIAFIIAATIAHSAVGFAQFMWLIQGLIMVGMWKTFGGEFTNSTKSWLSGVGAIMLVNTVVQTAFPQYTIPVLGAINLGLFGSLFQALVVIPQFVLAIYLLFAPIKMRWKVLGLIGLTIGSIAISKSMAGSTDYSLLGLAGVFKNLVSSGGGWIVIIGIIIAIVIGIAKAKDAKNSLIALWTNRAGKKLMNWTVRNVFDKLPILKMFKIKDSLIPEQMPDVIYNNMLLFHYLNTICKRTMIYYAYYGVVTGAEAALTAKHDGHKPLIEAISEHAEYEKVKIELIKYRSGKEINPQPGHDYFKAGWAGLNEDICEKYNEFVTLSIVLMEAVNDNDTTKINEIQEKVKKMTSDVNSMEENIKKMWSAWEHRLHAYQAHRVIDSLRMGAYGLANSSGFYPHSYLFAKPGAKLRNSNDKVPSKAELKIAGKTRYWEVDAEGYVLEEVKHPIDNWTELSQIKKGFGKEVNEKKKKKLLDVKDTLWFDKDDNQATEVLSFLDLEWREFLRDMRFGKYHPYSRLAEDYVHNYSLANPVYDDDKITRNSGPSVVEPGNPGNPTFDLRMLSDPGYWKYWGRKNYYDQEIRHSDANPITPWPYMSLVGTSIYIAKLVDMRTRDISKIQQYLKLFPAVDQYGDPDHLIGSLENYMMTNKPGGGHG